MIKRGHYSSTTYPHNILFIFLLVSGSTTSKELRDTMSMRTCEICEEEFDLNSPEKKRARGKINHCPDCSEETATRYLAVKSANGKMSDLTILAFEDEQQRDNYQRAWRASTGFNKGKSCHLSKCMPSMSGLKFRKVGENQANANHKGKC